MFIRDMDCVSEKWTEMNSFEFPRNKICLKGPVSKVEQTEEQALRTEIVDVSN